MKKLFLAVTLLLSACSCSESEEIPTSSPMSDRIEILKQNPVRFERSDLKYRYEGFNRYVAEINNPDIFDFSYDDHVDARIVFPIDKRSFELVILDRNLSGTIEWCSECDIFHLIADGYEYEN